MTDVVVVGGGISGLAAAYTLQRETQRQGIACNLHILEASDRWGGKITTQRVDGFVIEGGPDTFLRSKPWGVALCRELGLESRLHGTNPHHKNTFVLNSSRLRPLPEGLMMMIPTQFAPVVKSSLLTWSEKARMGLDFFLPPHPRNSDESLGEFVSRRLGRSAYEKLIEPLMSGIYAGDGDRLSLEATFPYLRELEIKHGGLVKGALAVRRQRAKNTEQGPHSQSLFLTPTTGLAEIVEALVESLLNSGAHLLANTSVSQVGVDAERNYLVEASDNQTFVSQGLILAAPAYVSGNIVSAMDSELAEQLTSIPYATTATISLAYRLQDLPGPLDGYGYVIPKREGRQALACTWTSSKFPHRAPEGTALLRVFIGRAGQERDNPWDEDYLLAAARHELRQTLGIEAMPLLTRVFYWEKAMPQYNLGHMQKLGTIHEHLKKWPGLALAGNGYRGIGIPDCIHSGEEAAFQLLSGWRDKVTDGT